MSTTINFPDSPSVDDTYNYGDVTYKFDGTRWYVVGAAISVTFETLDAVGDVGTGADQLAVGNDSRLSDNRTPLSNSVIWGKLANELKAIVALSGTAIDWDSGIEFTKTLAANTTFTDTDLVKGKVIVLHITGDYSITFPAYWDIMKGSETYDGTVANKIVCHCIESAGGSEEVEYSISQKAG
jgi:hypothetical protein